MAHLRDDFGKGVVAERGVDKGAHRGDKVAQRFRREPAAQVDRNGQRHGAQSIGLLALLLFQNHVDEYSGEILRDGRAVLFCFRAQRLKRHKAHRHMEGIERLRRSGILIRLRLAVQPQRMMSRVAGVGVLHLLRARRLGKVEHAVPRRHVNAGLAQVLGKQCAEKDDRPAAVGQRVEDLNGDAAAVIVKAHEPAVVLLEPDGLARVGHIFFQKRPRRGIRLKIVPECALANAHGKARKARHAAINGMLKRGGVNVPLHQRGEAVDGRILFLLQRGVQNACIVEPIPFAVRFCHRFPLLRVSGSFGQYCSTKRCARQER